MNEKAEIFVIDDTPENLEVVTDALTVEGYSVAAATSGKRALRRLQNYLPDLILLDIQMPGMDGFETCSAIKSDARTAHIPIIFITALSDPENIARGFTLGAVDYVTKPFQEAELLARVQTHVNLHNMNQRLEQQVAERTHDLELTMTQLQDALDQLKVSQLQVIQQEKMASLGNLVAGVAHEVNNPVGFLNGSISNATDYVRDLLGHLDLYQKHYPAPGDDIQGHSEDIDLDFLRGDFPKLLASMQTASDRIQKISASLRTFSRADKQHPVMANIHEGIDSTLLILKYRLKANEARPEIQIIKEYGTLPLVNCFPGQLNQVFMNILANAIDMFDELAEMASYDELDTNPQVITIQTEWVSKSDAIAIRIRDNGKGMDKDVMDKAFDHLFTTKEVGKGTGLGLAIANQIITQTHGGSIAISSEMSMGTEFCIHLPIRE